MNHVFTQPVTIVLCVAGMCLPGMAHETETKLPDPGFRPKSEHAAEFVRSAKSSTIEVHPSIVRTQAGTTYSTVSQQRIVSLLGPSEEMSAVAGPIKLDPGELNGNVQWKLFQHSMETLGNEVRAQDSDEAYSLVMEFLVSPLRSGGLAVGGIHCFVLDRQGRNAFSFLLNSHHQLLVGAALQTDDASDAGRGSLVIKATEVGVNALLGQLHVAGHAATD